jgi:hypothetical protein
VLIPYVKRAKKKVKKMSYVETNFFRSENRGIYDLAFFDNMRRNLEEVP